MKKYKEFYDKKEEKFIYDGIHCNDFTEVLMAMLNWCPCSEPDIALQEVMKTLRHIDNLTEIYTKDMSWENWDKSNKELLSHFGHTLYYVLHEKKLTQHGCSIPGWLTEEGHKILELMESYYLSKKNN